MAVCGVMTDVAEALNGHGLVAEYYSEFTHARRAKLKLDRRKLRETLKFKLKLQITYK
jgi:hypothetical protein